jgi:hypothetical protein
MIKKPKSKFKTNPTLKTVLLYGAEIRYPSGFGFRLFKEKEKVTLRSDTHSFPRATYSINDETDLKHALEHLQLDRKKWEREEKKQSKKIKIHNDTRTVSPGPTAVL